MHILLIAIIVMGLATILLIGWAQGQLFACVFLSIPPALGLLIIAMRTDPALPIYPQLCFGALAIIWTPRYLIRRSSIRPKRRKPTIHPNIHLTPNYFAGVKPYVAPYAAISRVESGSPLVLTDGRGRK